MSQSKSQYVAIGLMLFALFFGAGNLIFPVSMGQAAGENVWWAVLGFCLTGVGMPLICVVAMGYSGCRDLQEAASRVHPIYGIFFTLMVYLSIGPCLAMPRTGTVAFEIAIRPFLSGDAVDLGLPIFLAIFFAISCWLAATPNRMVDRIGKMLTPLLLAAIFVLLGKSFMTPMGEFMAPTAAYAEPAKAAIQGILDGYNTLDALASFVFAYLIINAVVSTGVTDPKEISTQVIKSGTLAVGLLAFVYILLAKLGAESVQAIGMQDTGAGVLTMSTEFLLGQFGMAVLAVIVLLACLTTCVGLISCCAAFFQKLTNVSNYKSWCVFFAIFIFCVGMFGLKVLISAAIPVLMFVYPLAVALIALLLLDKTFGGARVVYVSTTACTFVMALCNGLETAGVSLGVIGQFFVDYVPLHTVGMGWVGFAIVGYVIGLVLKYSNCKCCKG